MNKILTTTLLLSIIFFSGCEEALQSEEIKGCTTESACNFNSNANVDDGTCLQNDCDGTCGGLAILDNCNTCDTDSTNDCDKDCNGDYGGTASIDKCGICSGGTTEKTACINSSWVFVANEGNFGSSNGAISMIDDSGTISHTESIGDVVQSLAIYKNK